MGLHSSLTLAFDLGVGYTEHLYVRQFRLWLRNACVCTLYVESPYMRHTEQYRIVSYIPSLRDNTTH